MQLWIYATMPLYEPPSCRERPSRAATADQSVITKEPRIGAHPGRRHRADFGECLLLEDEPPFLPGRHPKLPNSYSHLVF